jgi:hypothetical protein
LLCATYHTRTIPCIYWQAWGQWANPWPTQYCSELYVKNEFSLTNATPSMSKFFKSVLMCGINSCIAFFKVRRSLWRGMLVYIAFTSPLHSMILEPRGREGILQVLDKRDGACANRGERIKDWCKKVINDLRKGGGDP